jgi:hypothetical protein
MRILGVYALRIVLFFLGTAAVLRFSYGPATPYDHGRAISYLVVCAILTLCGLAGWAITTKVDRILRWIASAAIASMLTFGLIQLSEITNTVGGFPWQYFYKDDYVLVFQMIAPAAVGVLTALLSLIPTAKHSYVCSRHSRRLHPPRPHSPRSPQERRHRHSRRRGQNLSNHPTHRRPSQRVPHSLPRRSPTSPKIPHHPHHRSHKPIQNSPHHRKKRSRSSGRARSNHLLLIPTS